MAKIRGNNRANTIDGTSGTDELRGEGGNDSLSGLGGSDKLRGGDGDDTITGGDGNDRLRGEHNDDMLTGGAGNDRFEFSNNGGSDTVTDFHHGEDVLYVSAQGVATMADLAIGSNAAGDAVVSFLSGGDITAFTLIGIDAASLTASDFIFRPH